MIHVQTKQAKAAHKERRDQIISDLKKKIDTLSRKLLGKPMEIDTEELSNSMGRKKLQRQLRSINLGHLDIAKHLCNLESDEILRKNLMV